MAKSTLTEVAVASLDRFAQSRSAFDYSGIPDLAMAERAQAAEIRIKGLQRDAMGAIVEIGRELNRVKEELKHGTFITWVEALGLNRRTATNYMAAASAFGDKWETVSHLPAATIYKLASPNTPPEVREAVFQHKPGQDITIDSIDFITSETEKARRRRKEFKEQRAEEQRAEEAAKLDPKAIAKVERIAKREAREQVEELAVSKKELSDAAEAADMLMEALGPDFERFMTLSGDASGEAFAYLLKGRHRLTWSEGFSQVSKVWLALALERYETNPTPSVDLPRDKVDWSGSVKLETAKVDAAVLAIKEKRPHDPIMVRKSEMVRFGKFCDGYFVVAGREVHEAYLKLDINTLPCVILEV